MTVVHKLTALLCLAAIGGSAAFAYRTERGRRDDYLQGQFEGINVRFFGGQLKGVRVEWAVMDDLGTTADKIEPARVRDPDLRIVPGQRFLFVDWGCATIQ